MASTLLPLPIGHVSGLPLMSHPNSFFCRGFAALAMAAPLLLLAPAARAGSSRTVAAIGDAAPGGGLFAGPGFSGWPSAAGEGWVAFRALLSGGSAAEALVVAQMKPPASSAQVAVLGGDSPGDNGHEACAGTFKQFLGRPIVNRGGEVAFLAIVEPAGEPEGEADPFKPVPAGIFLYSGNRLTAIACSGEETAVGRLDLVAVVDPVADPSEIVDRSPALNDRGEVAYLAGLFPDTLVLALIFLYTLGTGLTIFKPFGICLALLPYQSLLEFHMEFEQRRWNSLTTDWTNTFVHSHAPFSPD